MNIGRGRGGTGRGFLHLKDDKPVVLRKPGEFNGGGGKVVEESEKKSQNTQVIVLNSKLKGLESCSSTDEETKFSDIEDFLKFCIGTDRMEGKEIIDTIHIFCLLSRKNSHLGAKLCQKLAHLDMGQSNFRVFCFNKIQSEYQENDNKLAGFDQYMKSTAFLFECFCHFRDLKGNCFGFLASPIIKCILILLESCTEPEVALVAEFMPIYGKDLKAQEPEAFSGLLLKIREKIISTDVKLPERALLLSVFEQILTDWGALDFSATSFYEISTTSFDRFCE